MTLVQLKYIITVAGQNSFNDAAKVLFISQPSLSAAVRALEKEIGILYLNDFNRNVLTKLFTEYNLQFEPLMECRIYVYLWKGHPLADREEMSLEDLEWSV